MKRATAVDSRPAGTSEHPPAFLTEDPASGAQGPRLPASLAPPWAGGSQQAPAPLWAPGCTPVEGGPEGFPSCKGQTIGNTDNSCPLPGQHLQV